MSRSRRAPFYTEGYGGTARKGRKRAANKAVRQSKDNIADGKAYRKEFNSWDIVDYKFHEPNKKNWKVRSK